MDLFTHASEQRMKPEAPLAGKAELHVVIDAALERRKLYQKKTVLFVKGVVEVQ